METANTFHSFLFYILNHNLKLKFMCLLGDMLNLKSKQLIKTRKLI